MIGLLNNLLPSRLGANLLKYQKLGSSIPWNYSAGGKSSSLLIKPVSSTRGVTQHAKPPSMKARKLQTQHGVPLSYDIIYNTIDYHAATQYISTAFLSVFAVAGPYLLMFQTDEVFPDWLDGSWNIYLSILFLAVNTGLAVTAYRSPIRIYHNRANSHYIAIFNHFIPSKIRTLEFNRGMVNRIPAPDILTLFKSEKYKIKDKTVFMFYDNFRYPSDLYGMFHDMEREQ